MYFKHRLIIKEKNHIQKIGKKGNNVKKRIKLLFLIIWMLVIFFFSHQPHSNKVTHSLIETILPSLKSSNYLDIINFSIRKLAHIAEYFILSFLTISLLKEYTKNERIIIFSTIIFCFLYACSDELHQLFIAGRTSKFGDVIIDTIGSIINIIIYKVNKKGY